MQQLSLFPGAKVFVAGASSDIGMALAKKLMTYPIQLGLHGHTSKERLLSLSKNEGEAQVQLFQKKLDTVEQGRQLALEFLNWAQGIDIFIQLFGNIDQVVSWEKLDEGVLG